MISFYDHMVRRMHISKIQHSISSLISVLTIGLTFDHEFLPVPASPANQCSCVTGWSNLSAGILLNLIIK